MNFFRSFLIFALFFYTNVAFAVEISNSENENNEILNSMEFDDLIELSKTETLNNELKKKLNLILFHPIVDNSIAPQEPQELNHSPIIGNFIRVASWNIARGRNIDIISKILTDSDEFYSSLQVKPNELKKIQEEAEILKNADILLIDEADIGMPRTEYKNIPEELAKNLGFNYAFGLEFLEVDPSHLGRGDYIWSEEKLLFPNENYTVDKLKYKGFHGNAILSRFPLKNVRIVRLPEAYDWLNDEKDKVVPIEYFRRKASDLIFDECIFREIRRGNRIALIADVQIPGSEQPLTVISVHLENRCVPKYRYKQIKALLEEIKDINNPVVIGGDMNTSTRDGRPTTIIRELRKKLTDVNFIGKQVVHIVVPQSLAISAGQCATNLTRKYRNPTVVSIPIISPNEERKFFSTLEDFKFSDQGKFDFEGDKYRATKNKRGRLSASNQRSFKGFKPTFLFERHWEIGKFKLDWLFVKPGEDSFAPFYGRTLHELNYSLSSPISDHSPITVDLPVTPPDKKEVKQRKKLLKKIDKDK